ncbi:MAG TPA: sigma-54 dependent transcriptional regulator [Opitutaceae bacterium]
MNTSTIESSELVHSGDYSRKSSPAAIECAKILVLDSTPTRKLAASLHEILRNSLNLCWQVNHEVIGTPLGAQHWKMMSRIPADVVVLILANGETGQLLASCGEHAAGNFAPLIAVVEEGEPREIAALLRAGIADYIAPPLSSSQVLPRIMRLLPDARAGNGAGHFARPKLGRSAERLVGRSPAFVAELEKIPRISDCEAGVLIEGETGTGKELFARAIHDNSPRAHKPFVPVNCGAIPVELAESELFGHERGAFTGAYAAHKGVFAQADGGTLFFDEVTSLPLLTQVKLLRFLQEREYRPLGSHALLRADVRVIAAADTQLENAVKTGGFRQDLFYRLNIIRFMLPPLRERREDIPLLADFFLAQFSRRQHRPVASLGRDAMEKLVRYDWPGNVRELENVIERSVVLCAGPVATDRDITLPEISGKPDQELFQKAKARTVARFERSYIEGLLAANRGNISSSAKRAGKNRRAFWELIRKHDIDVERFRAQKFPEV